MPLFPEVSTYYKGRTHTSLVVSEGMAPAERYIPSRTENVKFQYEFGPEGNQNVVIPKGKIVTAAGIEWDYETEHNVPAIKIAGKDDPILGVNHHNVYERRRDRFSGNQPTVITREYIEVPLFPNIEQAAAIKFGAAWVTANDNLDAANKLFGQKVAVDENGNFTLATPGTYENIIGQVYGVETDVPPAGYLQYFMEMDDARWNEFIKQMSYAPSPGRTQDAAWNDIGTYPVGSGYLKDKKDLIKNFRAGIPFLTDGYFRARTQKTYKLSDADVSLKVSGHVTVTENYDLDGAGAGTETDTVISVTEAQRDGAALFIKIPEKFAMDALKSGSTNDYPEFANGPAPSNTVVTVGGVQYDDFHVDVTNNMIVVYLSNITADITNAQVSVQTVVLENQIPGIPTGWDFKGAYGAVRILLQK